MTQIIENRFSVRTKFIVFITLLLILAIGVSLVWFGLWGRMQSINENSAASTPMGTLVMTNGSVERTDDSARLLPASFDFSGGGPFLIEIRGKFLTGIHHSVSQNGEWLTFVNNTSSTDGTSEQGIWPNAVYRVNVKDNILEAMAQAAENAEVLSQVSMPAFPAIANDGSVLYMSSTYPSLEDPYLNAGVEDWEIVLMKGGSEPVVVAQGLHPQWLDNENFLFIKNDGLYLYSLKSESEARLAPFVSGAAPSSRLAINAATKQVLFIEPRAGVVRLFSIEETQEGSLVLNEEDPIIANATSAVFSHDGKYVALTAMKDVSEQSNELRLTIYSLDNRSVVHESTLPNASLTFTSLQTWLP